MKEEQKKIMAKVVAKAWADEDYKKNLLANPKEVLENEGLEIPEEKKINILENTKDTLNFVLPMPDSTLDAEDLEDRKAAFCLCHEICDGSGLCFA